MDIRIMISRMRIFAIVCVFGSVYFFARSLLAAHSKRKEMSPPYDLLQKE